MELVFAYIDPGSGSLIIQALIAGLVALPIFFRSHVSRAIGAIRRTKSAESSIPTGPEDGTNRV